jgi:predicted nucleic acid-binding protein
MARQSRPRRHRLVRETSTAGYEASAQEGLTGVLYDSDVIIEILRGRLQVVEAATVLEGGGVPTYCTAVTVAEVYARVRRGEETLTDAFLAARGEVFLDAKIGRRAGEYLARYAKSHGVEIADALIAAAASTSGLQLWTLNRKHYPMTDLRFYDP